MSPQLGRILFFSCLNLLFSSLLFFSYSWPSTSLLQPSTAFHSLPQRLPQPLLLVPVAPQEVKVDHAHPDPAGAMFGSERPLLRAVVSYLDSKAGGVAASFGVFVDFMALPQRGYTRRRPRRPTSTTARRSSANVSRRASRRSISVSEHKYRCVYTDLENAFKAFLFTLTSRLSPSARPSLVASLSFHFEKSKFFTKKVVDHLSKI